MEKKKFETKPSPWQAQQSKPTHGFSKKKKKKKPTQNQKSNLPTVPTVTSLQRIQRKPIPNILRQSIQITIYKAKTKQTKSNKLCLSKKKTPIQSLCTKTAKPNQNPNTRSSVTVTCPSSLSPQLAPHRISQIVNGRLQLQITLLSSGARYSVIVDRRSLRTLPELQLLQVISNFSLFFSH